MVNIIVFNYRTGMYQIHVQNEHLINHNTKMFFLHFFSPKCLYNVKMQRKMYKKNNNNNMKHLLFLNNIG